MLKVEHISKSYGSLKAVDDLSFTVSKGEIFGLLGINGSGKTTTFRVIMGLLEPEEGIVTLNDKKIDYSITDNIGFLTEERSLLTKLTVKEQVDYYAKLKSMDSTTINTELDYWLDRFNISEYKDKKIKELSKGNQQKIQFITAVIHKPELLILDEPFAGLDPINIEMFKDAIRELKDNGSIIIFSTHRMDHVELFCEKLVILVKGKNILSGKMEDIKTQYRKKNIIIAGDIDKKQLENIEGVISVTKKGTDTEVKIENNSITEEVFNYIKTCKNITKFVVEEPSLNEIFVDKVGETYEK